MKVLYITEIYPDVEHGIGVWGGGEKQFFEISQSVAERGNEVVVLSCRFPKQPVKEGIGSVRVVRQGLTRDSRTGGARRVTIPIVSYILSTVRQALRMRPDVIHCNTYFPVYAGRIAALFLHVPLVATFHDIYTLGEWIESQRSAPWGFLGHSATIIAVNLARHRIIAVSPQCMNKLVMLGVRRENITVIPNGVNLRLFDSTKAERHPAQVLYVGRLVRLKRVDLLIRAFSEVVKHIPRARLKIVGGGPEGESLRTLAGELGLQGRVTFTGVTRTYDDVARHFRESTLFVLPSTVEGESIAAKEAMAASLPVIAVRIRGSGILSIVHDGENGLLVEPNNTTMMAEAIVELLKDRERREAMGAAGRMSVDAFDWREVADRTLRAYREVVGSGQNKGPAGP